MIATAAAMRTLQRRLTVIATVAIALLLAGMAVALLGLQRRQLVDALDETMRDRADELEAGFAAGAPAHFAVEPVEDRALQLVGQDGTVLAASASLAGAAPFPAPSGNQSVRTIASVLPGEDVLRLLSRRIEVAGRPGLLHIAASVDDIDEAHSVLIRSLMIAFPWALVALAVLAWLLTGWALGPVTAAARRQQQFVGDASHELRSPLARARARLEVDLAHPAGADAKSTARAVLDETVGMERLIDDLLYLAQADETSGRRNVRADPPVDLDDVVMSEVTAARVTASVRLDPSGVSGAAVRGSAPDLGRLVRNLLDNALGHAVATVRVALHDDGCHVTLTIDDDGPGIPVARRGDVFARFARLDDARPHDGSGLGLSIADEIVKRHGGVIEAGEAPDGGARLRVVLPSLA